VKPAPPSPQAWYVDGYLRGHTLEQTLGYFRQHAAYADQQERLYRPPAGAYVVSPDLPQPRWRLRWPPA
jgi:hypothetical protein